MSRSSTIRSTKVCNAISGLWSEELRDVLDDARSKGCGTLQAVADHMNGKGFPTPRGGRWVPASVARLVAQIEKTA